MRRHFCFNHSPEIHPGRAGIRKWQRRGAVLLAGILLMAMAAPVAFAKNDAGVSNQKTEKESTQVSGKSTGSLTPKQILKSMTLEQKIAQMLMPSVRDESGSGHTLTELTSAARAAIEKYGFGGYIFFTQNCQSVEQLTRLTADMQRAAVDEDSEVQIPLLLAADQEGGRIERIGSDTRTPGNMALGASWDASAAEETAEVIGSEMAAVGLNVDFAPVMDVNSNPANSVIGIRSFGSDASMAGEMGAALVSGLQQSGVAATMKHFPGHGDTATDSHTGLPLIDKSLSELKKEELIPFQKGIDAGADMIMTAHIEFPQIEKDTYTSKKNGQIITLPATLSDDILTGLLREKMGFDGVIVTDAINMSAISEHFELMDAMELAINAGADIILMPGDITTEAHAAKLGEYIDNLAERVEKGSIEDSTIDQAVLRILKLKEKRGLLADFDKWDNLTDKKLDQMVKTAEKTTNSKEHQNRIRKITEKTITLLKNDDETLPVSGGTTVIFCPDTDTASVVKSEIASLREEENENQIPSVSVISYKGLSASSAAGNAAGADTVIGISDCQSFSSIGKDSAATVLKAAMTAVHQNGGTFTLISSFLPYDTAAYQEADAILATFGYCSLTENPKDRAEENTDYGPNLPAAIRAVFGAFTPSGSSPVAIPSLNTSGQAADEILYPAGFGIQNWTKEKTVQKVSAAVSEAQEGDSSDGREDGGAGNQKKGTVPFYFIVLGFMVLLLTLFLVIRAVFMNRR